MRPRPLRLDPRVARAACLLVLVCALALPNALAQGAGEYVFDFEARDLPRTRVAGDAAAGLEATFEVAHANLTRIVFTLSCGAGSTACSARAIDPEGREHGPAAAARTAHTAKLTIPLTPLPDPVTVKATHEADAWEKAWRLQPPDWTGAGTWRVLVDVGEPSHASPETAWAVEMQAEAYDAILLEARPLDPGPTELDPDGAGPAASAPDAEDGTWSFAGAVSEPRTLTVVGVGAGVGVAVAVLLARR